MVGAQAVGVSLMVTVRGEILVIVNQTPHTGYHGDAKVVYRMDECNSEVERVFGKAPLWIPVGPSVRLALEQHHSDELSRICWSDNSDDILAAYPDDPSVRVEILGGGISHHGRKIRSASW